MTDSTLAMLQSATRERARLAALGKKSAELDDLLAPFLTGKGRADFATLARARALLRSLTRDQSPAASKDTTPTPLKGGPPIAQNKRGLETLRRHQTAIAFRIALLQQRKASMRAQPDLSFLLDRLARVTQQIRLLAGRLNVDVTTPPEVSKVVLRGSLATQGRVARSRLVDLATILEQGAPAGGSRVGSRQAQRLAHARGALQLALSAGVRIGAHRVSIEQLDPSLRQRLTQALAARRRA